MTFFSDCDFSKQHLVLQQISDFNGDDRFTTRVGVNGLINLQKVHLSQIVLGDIRVFQRHAVNTAEKPSLAPVIVTKRYCLSFKMCSDQVF